MKNTVPYTPILYHMIQDHELLQNFSENSLTDFWNQYAVDSKEQVKQF